MPYASITATLKVLAHEGSWSCYLLAWRQGARVVGSNTPPVEARLSRSITSSVLGTADLVAGSEHLK